MIYSYDIVYCLVFVIASLADLNLINISLFGIDLLEILSLGGLY